MESIKNIIVVCGGSSSERTISLDSGQGIYESLLRLGFDAEIVDFININDLNIFKNYDLVFIALHGHEGEAGLLQKKLELLEIKYTGSASEVCRLTWDKSATKKFLNKKQISTPKSIDVSEIKKLELKFSDIPFDHFFIKPSMEGSSINIFEIKDNNDYEIALEKLKECSGLFIIEEAINYKEYTVSIIGDKCYPPIEIITENNFYDYDAKYISDKTQLIEVSKDNLQFRSIVDLSIKTFNALGCSGWCRIDILEDENFNLYVLEVNTVPGMTSHSCVPKSGGFDGLSYDSVVKKIIDASSL